MQEQEIASNEQKFEFDFFLYFTDKLTFLLININTYTVTLAIAPKKHTGS